MKFEFESNEFTSWEILEYLKRAYGSQINGTPFMAYHLQNWIRLKKLPEAYGGNKINGIRYKELSNLLILTVEGLDRNELIDLIGSLVDYEETKNRRRKLESKSRSRTPRKQRTKLYYQILEKLGKQSTKKTLSQSILPECWKESGIKRNQFSDRAKSKAKNSNS